MSERISLRDVRLDGGTQPRANLDMDTVTAYADLLLDGVKLPPVVVFYDGTAYWLADGFHRVHAFNKIATVYVEADVRQGTKRDAVLYSVGANATHGKPRTNLDKRRAVNVLLSDEEWSQKSDRWVAEKAAVGNVLVSRMRSETATVSEKQLPTTRLGKDGKERALPKPKSNPPAPPKPEPKQTALPGPVAETKAEAKADVYKAHVASTDAPRDEEPPPNFGALVAMAHTAALTESLGHLAARNETAPSTFATLLDRIVKLSSEDRASLVCEVVDGLDPVHLHRVREALDAREKES